MKYLRTRSAGARIAHLPEVVFSAKPQDPFGAGADLFPQRTGFVVRGYLVTHELLEGRLGTRQLAELASMAAGGGLRTEIDLIVPWTEAAVAITALLERRVRGKAVLTIGP